MSVGERLAELREAATPGPWVAATPGPEDIGAGLAWIDTHAYEEGPEPVVRPSYVLGVEDAALIVALVNAAPQIEALVRAAERVDPEWNGDLLDALAALEAAVER